MAERVSPPATVYSAEEPDDPEERPAVCSEEDGPEDCSVAGVASAEVAAWGADWAGSVVTGDGVD